MPAERILLVDDEPDVRRTRSRVLTDLGYECDAAGSIAEAREKLEASDFDLVICDLHLPGESGMTLVGEIERSDAEVALLIATAIDDPSIAHTAAAHGVDGYLIKPFSNNELQINVECALKQSRRRSDIRNRAEQHLANNGGNGDDLRFALIHAAASEDELIDRERALMLGRLSRAIGERDIETGDHVRRIGKDSGVLARYCGTDEDEFRRIGLAAPMHDIGKVAIPDAILLKPGPLTPEERKVMERHTEIGHEILARTGSPLLDLAASIALTHHERFDGAGYPRGLAGEEIPLPGRIVAVTDVFDALVSDRPYRPALTVERAIEIMSDERGTHFDPELFDCFLENLDRFEVPAHAH